MPKLTLFMNQTNLCLVLLFHRKRQFADLQNVDFETTTWRYNRNLKDKKGAILTQPLFFGVIKQTHLNENLNGTNSLFLLMPLSRNYLHDSEFELNLYLSLLISTCECTTLLIKIRKAF